MLVLSTQASVFAATCYIVSPGPGGPCLVLDPGVGVTDGVARLVASHGLRPVAVAATHGHPDHLWDAAAVCDRWAVPFYLHHADLERLASPAASLGPGMAEGFLALAGGRWQAPSDARPLPDGTFEVGDGLELALIPAPGHTPGSTVVIAPGSPDPGSVVPPSVTRRPLGAASAVAFTGDVLFADSIGRMDLPGGDEATMARTLLELRRLIPTDAWVLPGHGPSTTMARERARNPYLAARWTPGQY